MALHVKQAEKETQMRASRLLTGLLIAVASICLPSAAQALQIDGNISVTMNIRPNCGDNDADCLNLNNATALDFIFTSGGLATPGIPGIELVTDADGDLNFLDGALGTVKDFSFAGAGTPNFPLPPVLEWETIGGLTIDLLSVAVSLQGGGILVLEGTALFHLAGFEDTPGTFSLTAQQSGTTFSASASKGTVPTVPDGGSTAALLGSVLVAFGILRRRFI
jgi:VPDSG-CTERM motif